MLPLMLTMVHEHGQERGCTINYHPQSGWFEDAPLKGGAVMGMPPQGALLQEAPAGG